jgi:hypothetical protein
LLKVRSSEGTKGDAENPLEMDENKGDIAPDLERMTGVDEQPGFATETLTFASAHFDVRMLS